MKIVLNNRQLIGKTEKKNNGEPVWCLAMRELISLDTWSSKHFQRSVENF